MIDNAKNKIYIGSEDRLQEWNEQGLIKIRLLLKNYLELDNVSFLFGAGSSIHLGSISIANIPVKLEEEIRKIPNNDLFSEEEEAYLEFLKIVLDLQKSDEIIRTDSGCIKYPIEDLLNYLNAIHFVASKNSSIINLEYLEDIIFVIKRVLFELCDLDQLRPNPSANASEVDKEKLQENRYYLHERFVKKLLQRPLNLKRGNIFTTNYDLAFENAFDNQGVNYIDGFSGFQNRTFKPETYDYDIYYPGSTTQGKVSRIEKVLRYYKIHGSLTWVKTPPSATNIYGIKEIPIELIRNLKDSSTKSPIGDIMIYPSATKKSYTLDFPYSELFRQFSTTITQSQSVLLTYGYSFCDEHINDIIYQALSIPSFTLIVIDYLGTQNEGIRKLKELNDPRIIILEGSDLGDFLFFTQNIMPDLVEMNTEELVVGTMNKIYQPQKIESETQNVYIVDDNTSAEASLLPPTGVVTDNISREDDDDDLPF